LIALSQTAYKGGKDMTTTNRTTRAGSHLRRNLIALVALFVALGGTAAALPGKNTVDSGDIKKKAVKTRDIAKQAVTEPKLADGAVTTAKLANGAVTGAKADEGSFEGLIKGDGRQSTVSATVDTVGFLPQSVVLAEVPTMGVVELIACFPQGGPGAGADIRTRLLSFDDAQPFFGAGTVIGGANPQGTGDGTKTEQTAGIFSAGGGSPLIAEGQNGVAGATGTSAYWDWQFSRGTGQDTVGAHVSVSGYNSSTAGNPSGQCTVTATVEYQD
jgi:hypothetical protein